MKNFALAALVMAALALSLPAKAADQVCPWVVTPQELVTLRTPIGPQPSPPVAPNDMYTMVHRGQLIVMSEILLKDPQFLEFIRAQYEACLKAKE